MDIINFIAPIFIGFMSAFIVSLFMKKRFTRPIVMESDMWQPIDTVPIEDSFSDIYLTDGKSVRNSCTIKYNKYGQVTFGYEGKIATHWMPRPLPPKDK
jgi:uncharacterized Fe-S radical SAM superfamily protein PflX